MYEQFGSSAASMELEHSQELRIQTDEYGVQTSEHLNEFIRWCEAEGNSEMQKAIIEGLRAAAAARLASAGLQPTGT